MPFNNPGSAGATELNLDAPERERYGFSCAQTVTSAAGVLSTPDGGLFDASAFDEIEVLCVVYAKAGGPTSATIVAQESDTNESAGQSPVPGAQLAFTGGVDLLVGSARAFRVRWRGRKRYFGVSVEVSGGTNVGLAVVARGIGVRDSREARAPSTALQGTVLE